MPPTQPPRSRLIGSDVLSASPSAASCGREAAPHTHRRHLLGAFAGTYVASLIPWALAQPVASAEQAPFMALSALLTGRTALDAELGQRLHAALVAAQPGFAADARALLDWINTRQVDPARLQQALDDARSPLAPLPRLLARAWFMGIVGEGAQARVLAYEEALNAQIVADVLRPPSYAYGPYGSWVVPPKEEPSRG